MPTSSSLRTRFPEGTKYVIEGRGPFVYRHIEYPDGERLELPPRKAATCTCVAKSKAAAKRTKNPARKSLRRAA
jgi:hypothetical protein